MKSNDMKKLTLSVFFLCTCLGCKKLTQVPEPVDSITTTETYSTDATATAAIIGIYNDMSGNGQNFNFNDGIGSVEMSLSADELQPFNGSTSALQFATNTMNSSNSDLTSYVWNGPYFDIYIANSAIENLPAASGVSAPIKKQLLGEAKFFRAFLNFYLVNLFGDVPLVKTNAYAINDTLHRSPVAKVYQQIIADLQDAQTELAPDYSVSGGQRIRVNQSGATALLARVYLYQQQWKNAELQASSIINNTGLYTLAADLNTVFLAGNSESILQWQTIDVYPYATQFGSNIIPDDNTSRPNFFLTQQLTTSFEFNDQRKVAWVDSTLYNGTTYYYPYKYKVKTGGQGNETEYYNVFRLAEQYLIRAEARAQQGNLTGATGAIADLNVIRERAGLPDLSASLNQTQVLAAVAQERKIELFCEWGHRWLDLKRWSQAGSVLSADKGFAVPANQLLYPIPAPELIDDPNLVQNPGY